MGSTLIQCVLYVSRLARAAKASKKRALCPSEGLGTNQKLTVVEQTFTLLLRGRFQELMIIKEERK
jgi:hypothetical protein